MEFFFETQGKLTVVIDPVWRKFKHLKVFYACPRYLQVSRACDL